MRIDESLYPMILIKERYPNIEKEGGIDFNGNGKIEDEERLVDTNKNGKYDPSEYSNFLKENEKVIKKNIALIGNVYDCDNIGENNIIHDVMAVESDLFTPDEMKSAYKILDDLVGDLTDWLDPDARRNFMNPIPLEHMMGIIIDYLENKKGMEFKISPEQPSLKAANLFTENILLKTMNRQTFSFFILAVAEEMAKKDKKWENIGIVALQTYIFIKYGDMNLDLGSIIENKKYLDIFKSYSVNDLRAFKKNEEISVSYMMKGCYLGMKNDYKGAISALTRAVEINDKYSFAYNLRGISKNYEKDYNGAIVDFEKALEIDPKNYNIYNNRAVSKEGLGDYLGAVSDYTKSIEINPKNDVAYSERGRIKYYNNSDTVGALEDLKIAEKLGSKAAGYLIKMIELRKNK